MISTCDIERTSNIAKCTTKNQTLEHVVHSRRNTHAIDGDEGLSNDDDDRLNENNMNYIANEMKYAIQSIGNSSVNNNNVEFEDPLSDIENENIILCLTFTAIKLIM